MKKAKELSKRILVVLLGLALVTISCEEEDVEKVESSFTYDGTTYYTPKAVVANEGDTEGGGTDFELHLYSSEIDYIMNQGEINFNTGTGELVSFYLIANNVSENIAEGDYIYGGSYEFDNVFEFSDVNIDTDFGSEEFTGMYFEMDSGTLKVSKIGNDYLIEYSITLTNSKVLEGKYQGAIQLEKIIY